MSKILDCRQAISTLLDAGKTPTEISRDLQCARSLVYKVKTFTDDGKDVQPPPPRRKKTVMTPRVVAGLKRRPRIKAAPRKPPPRLWPGRLASTGSLSEKWSQIWVRDP